MHRRSAIWPALLVCTLTLWCTKSEAITRPESQAFGVADAGGVLREWVRRLGGEVDLVEIGEQGHMGNGARLNGPVEPGHTILRVPFAAAMTVHSAVSSAVYGPVLAELQEKHSAPSLVLLALHLLKEYQAGADSPWRAYIRLLPEDYNSMLHFTGPELKLLQGTAALKLWSGTTKPRFEEFYTYVQTFVVAKHQEMFPFSDDQLMWAFSTISTRAWEFDGEQHLVPLADLTNHKPGELSLTRSHNGSAIGGSYYFGAEHQYQSGDMLFQSYDGGGPVPGVDNARCDNQWLADYGFLPDTGPTDKALCVPLAISLSLGKFPDWKRELLDAADVLDKQYAILSDGSPNGATLGLLRIALLEDLGDLEGMDPTEITQRPIHFLNEAETLKQLTKMIRRLLDSHDQNIVGDFLLAMSSAGDEPTKLTLNAQLAMQYRKREEELLTRSIAKMKEMKSLSF